MKKCTVCGKFHWGNPNFCKSCGAAFDEQAVKAQAQTQVIDTENLQLAICFEDVFFITGKGTVVIGFSQSDISVGDILVNKEGTKKCKVVGMEIFRDIVSSVPPRTNVGLVLSNFTKADFVKNEPFYKVNK